ncbi:retrovirus-related Pol polyprotein from transposon 297 [Nephila pilipes]|uniref:Retrovirus-related Pol polyprotein from transposon 297 n=1 Tax=Nephila pilipes TaxID=299642 RepID=A0A8X6MWS0_NEPPI|nr:retrovirus-related Pol polyprotein from transposon 297 [Nephila pilipes]
MDFLSQVSQNVDLLENPTDSSKRKIIPVQVLIFDNKLETVNKLTVISEPFLVYLDDIVILGRPFEEYIIFKSLKQAFPASPVLTNPRSDKDFILETEARNEGIGAMLSQKMGNAERVITYFSKNLKVELVEISFLYVQSGRFEGSVASPVLSRG